jgi:hypothetical protein
MIRFDWSSPVGFHAEQQLHHIGDCNSSKHFAEIVSPSDKAKRAAPDRVRPFPGFVLPRPSY